MTQSSTTNVGQGDFDGNADAPSGEWVETAPLQIAKGSGYINTERGNRIVSQYEDSIVRKLRFLLRDLYNYFLSIDVPQTKSTASMSSNSMGNEPFTPNDGLLQELNSISRGLRGEDSSKVHSSGILSKVKDVARARLATIQAVTHRENQNVNEQVDKVTFNESTDDVDVSDITPPSSHIDQESVDEQSMHLQDPKGSQESTLVNPQSESSVRVVCF